MSSANLGSAFDVASVALDAFVDKVCVQVCPGDGEYTVTLTGPYAGDVENTNTAIGAARAVARRAGVEDELAVDIRVWKGVPVSKGLGSSGASAAAAAYAMAEALDLEVDWNEIIEAAGEGEAFGSGSLHYDNVSASVLGYYAFVTSFKPFRVARVEADWPTFLLAVPGVGAKKGKTSFMRTILPSHVGIEVYTRQLSRVAALVMGILKRDVELLFSGMMDEVVVPRRAGMVPCFEEVEGTVARLGGFATISGAGPSVIIVAGNEASIPGLKRGVGEAYERCGIPVRVIEAKPRKGVSLLPSDTWDSLSQGVQL